MEGRDQLYNYLVPDHDVYDSHGAIEKQDGGYRYVMMVLACRHILDIVKFVLSE